MDFSKWNFANLLSFNMVMEKAQLPCKPFAPVPQFPIPSNDQDEDVPAVFLPARFHIPLFLLLRALLVLAAQPLTGVGSFQS